MRAVVILLVLAHAVAAGRLTSQQAHANAKILVSHGRCDLVRKLGAELRELEPYYYANVFSLDPALSACELPRIEFVTESYRDTLITVDATTLGAAVAIDAFVYLQHREAFAGSVALTALGCFAAAPIVHLVERNLRGAASSAGIRILSPAIGAGIGALVVLWREPWFAYGPQPEPSLRPIAIGALVGAAVAYGVDWSVLPTVVRSRDATTVGIAMRF